MHHPPATLLRQKLVGDAVQKEAGLASDSRHAKHFTVTAIKLFSMTLYRSTPSSTKMEWPCGADNGREEVMGEGQGMGRQRCYINQPASNANTAVGHNTAPIHTLML